MPPTAHAAFPLDVLQGICACLPPGDVMFAARRVNRALAAAFAEDVEEIQAEDKRLRAECQLIWRPGLQGCVSVPLWALQEAWPGLSGVQRVRSTERAAYAGDVGALEWVLARLDSCHTAGWISQAAAAGAEVEALRCARAHGCPWNEGVCEAAAAHGQLHMLQWARAQDPPCPWDASTCEVAVLNGHLAVLQWARAQDPPCPWDGRTCESAARNGHLAVLQWARAQDPPCPWDAGTCESAARNGHLAVLQWARAQDPPCSWDAGTCEAAVFGGQLAALQWARAQNPPCPWDKMQCWGIAVSKIYNGGSPANAAVAAWVNRQVWRR